ncbi:MAG: lipase maturation factor family protein [Gammaproteobacteria bacterium]|nr:lipase maturation factor family protein [Gammaproteobacteria bacterium]
MTGTIPVLIYDGDCGICREWVDYWLSLTGHRVIYRSYQSAAADYPNIPAEEFRHSIRLFEGDKVYAGAAATLRLLSYVPGHGLGWLLYRFLPGFAAISEMVYHFSARHRGLLRHVTHLLWGRHYTAPRYTNTGWCFLRGLGLIYVSAFVSAAVQITGLIGESGLLPIADYLERMQGYYSGLAWYHVPTLFWIANSDAVLQLACLAGAAAGVLVTFNRLTTPALIAAFVLYLGIVHPGQAFFMFQWDLLLLEAGFLAIFLQSWPTMTRWLYRWLLWRYLFMAGIVKLISGDPTWHGLTALQYHFETQPLPTPLAWYAHQLPDTVLTAATAFTLLLELVFVFLVFGPRRFRMLLGWLVLVFQAGILLTGNYNFFNLLTMLLTLWLFDDAALARLTRGARSLQAIEIRSGITGKAFCILFSLMIVLPGLNYIARYTLNDTLPVGRQISAFIDPFMIVNPYGLFANMTTSRPEIVIEGSVNNRDWLAYEFRYKPGDPGRAPPWNILHQPRLDWQMWFAALGSPGRQSWFKPLLVRLLENETGVTRLFAHNPFPDSGPRYIRARLYDYRFTEPGSHDWWRRERKRLYYPAITLDEIHGRPRSTMPFEY